MSDDINLIYLFRPDKENEFRICKAYIPKSVSGNAEVFYCVSWYIGEMLEIEDFFNNSEDALNYVMELENEYFSKDHLEEVFL